ncbi:GGDEF domain-containing protein [Butyrivibrio sp. VCD2006]|uniref:GGDEF domain-containing protein n=1 Tax=Butyrivibrio sp. VCD2006 TaxID=1280664 RepID=UPI0004170E6C|nr:GGDEF domain-containing protein [Butyrivibrio sp. VCD2006]
MIQRKIPNDELNTFYQSKFEYYRKVAALAAIATGLLEVFYFISDCIIFGRFANETLIPRISIMVPILLFVLINPKVKDYKCGSLLYYMMPHCAMWATIWAIWFLPNRDFAREGFIIMHFGFLCVGLAMPVRYHIVMHAFLFLNIIVSNLFIHYEHFDMMIALAFPLYIGVILIMMILENSYADHYLIKKEIEKNSVTDPLTEVFNRNKLEEIVSADGEKLEVGHIKDASILMVDIDKFKRVNDTYGHEGGDKILVFVSDQIKKHIRSTDLIIRWGGEEFVVLLMGTALDVGLNIAEHIRSAVEAAENDVTPVTISVGVSKYEGGNYHDAINKADQALYYAKEHGRNLVVCYEDIEDEILRNS